MTQQRFRVIHSVDWRLALLVAVVLLALQGCTVIYAEQVGVVSRDAHVRQADNMLATGDAAVAHVDSMVAGVVEMRMGGNGH